MRRAMSLVTWGLGLPLVLGGSLLVAQTDDSKASSDAFRSAMEKCLPLNTAVPGESLADASRRIAAWRACQEKVRTLEEFVDKRLVKKMDVYKGRLVVGAKPSLGEGPTYLLNRLDIYVRTSSPLKYQYTLTVGCGPWNKTIAGSVEGSDASHTSKGLGEPSFSLAVVPPCNLNDISLELSQVRDSTGKEHASKAESGSASLAPGISEEEMKRRLLLVEPVEKRGAHPGRSDSAQNARRLSNNVPTSQQPAVPESSTESVSDVLKGMLEAMWQSKQSIDVYGGTIETAVKPIRSDLDGLVYKLVVRITNNGSEAYSVRYTVRCGPWTTTDRAYIGGSMTLDDNTPFRMDEPSMVYTPHTPCKWSEVGLDVVRKDVEPYECTGRNNWDYYYTLKGREAWEFSIGWGRCAH